METPVTIKYPQCKDCAFRYGGPKHVMCASCIPADPVNFVPKNKEVARGKRK